MPPSASLKQGTETRAAVGRARRTGLASAAAGTARGHGTRDRASRIAGAMLLRRRHGFMGPALLRSHLIAHARRRALGGACAARAWACGLRTERAAGSPARPPA